MTLYTLYCERCERRVTHEEVWTHDDGGDLSIEHPTNGTEVLCRDCDQGRSRADVPEDGLDVDVTAKVEVSVPVSIDPDDFEDDESIYEHVARLVREEHVDDVRENLDSEDVESAYIEREEGVWPRSERNL